MTEEWKVKVKTQIRRQKQQKKILKKRGEKKGRRTENMLHMKREEICGEKHWLMGQTGASPHDISMVWTETGLWRRGACCCRLCRRSPAKPKTEEEICVIKLIWMAHLHNFSGTVDCCTMHCPLTLLSWCSATVAGTCYWLYDRLNVTASALVAQFQFHTVIHTAKINASPKMAPFLREVMADYLQQS